jgi:hypothetical protein
MNDLARILATPPPPVVDPAARRLPRKERSALIRALFRRLGIKGVSVTTPSYSMAQSVDIAIPDAVEHDHDNGHERTTCPHCMERFAAERHIERIILAAFPDLADRSDSMSDHFDYCLSIH